MPKDEGERPAAALTLLLREERSALLKGDLSGLAHFTARKEALMAKLMQSRPKEAELTPLAQTAGETAAMMKAAQKGLWAARRRLAELARMKAGPVTYDASGRSVDPEVTAVRLEQKL